LFCQNSSIISPQERQPLFFNLLFSIHNRQQINCLNLNWQAWRFVSIDRVSIARQEPDWNELYAYKTLRWGAWNDKNLTKEFIRKMYFRKYTLNNFWFRQSSQCKIAHWTFDREKQNKKKKHKGGDQT